MKHPSRILRALVAVSLSFCMSMAALCAPMAAQVATSKGAAMVSQPARPKCCCGTKDGRCCGMACCMKSSSQGVPVNPPARPNADESQSLALAVLTADVACNHADQGNFAHGSHATLGGPLAVPSLQAQHVRIQT